MSNTNLRQILEDLDLLGFVKQSKIGPSSESTIANVKKTTEALERGVRAKVGKPSDVRLKRDIHHVATLEDGVRFYSFRYLWDDAVHVGVMAQELLRNETWRPSVSSENGYYTVNYGLLGLRMTTLDEWKAKGLKALRA